MLRAKYKIDLNEARDRLCRCVSTLDSELSERMDWDGKTSRKSQEAASLAAYEDTEICLEECLVSGIGCVPDNALASYAKEAAGGIWMLIDRRCPSDKDSPLVEALCILAQIAEAGGLALQDENGVTYFASLRETAEDVETGYIWARNGYERSCAFLAELEHVLQATDEPEKARHIAIFLEQAEEETAGSEFNTGTLKLDLYEDVYIDGVEYNGYNITAERRNGRIYIALSRETEDGLAVSPNMDVDEAEFFKMPSDELRMSLNAIAYYSAVA